MATKKLRKGSVSQPVGHADTRNNMVQHSSYSPNDKKPVNKLYGTLTPPRKRK